MLKTWDEFGIEIGKTDEAGNILGSFRSRPRLEELIFGLSWSVAILTYINSDKFEPFRKEETLSKGQR